jgi:hypothetical protein
VKLALRCYILSMWVIFEVLIAAVVGLVALFMNRELNARLSFWAPWLNRPTREHPLGALQICSRGALLWMAGKLILWTSVWGLHYKGGDPHHIVETIALAGMGLIWVRPLCSVLVDSVLAGAPRVGLLPYVTPMVMTSYVFPIMFVAAAYGLQFLNMLHVPFVMHSDLAHGLGIVGFTLIGSIAFLFGSLGVGFAQRYEDEHGQSSQAPFFERCRIAFTRSQRRIETPSATAYRTGFMHGQRAEARRSSKPAPALVPVEREVRLAQARQTAANPLVASDADPAIDEQQPVTDPPWNPGDPLPEIDFTYAEFKVPKLE